MRKKNVLIVCAMLAVIAILFGVAMLVRNNTKVNIPVDAPDFVDGTTDAPTAEPTAEPTAQPTVLPDVATAGIEVTEVPTSDTASDEVLAYLVISVNNSVYNPIPIKEERDYTVTQKSSGKVNVVHVTRDSMYMKTSTCEGHDCVNQGTVTLENKSTRILGDMIICLPNNVTLELLAKDELQGFLAQMMGNEQ